MTRDEARSWLEQHISTGFTDPRTLETSCREVVEYYKEHPDEQDLIAEALTEVMAQREWDSTEQIENGTYLAANLESVDALQTLVSALSELDDPTGEKITLAIAAIRSLPENGTVRDVFSPFLFRWLRCESVANLAFEALCDLEPEHSLAFFLALSHYHRTRPSLIESSLTHVYYQSGDISQGQSRVFALLETMTTLVSSVQSHPFLPDSLKQVIVGAVRTAVSEECGSSSGSHRIRHHLARTKAGR